MGSCVAERKWLELVADLLAASPTRLPDKQIALELCATFGLTACSYNDSVAGRWVTLRLWPEDEQLGGRRGELVEWTHQRAAQQHPLLRFYLRTGRRVPMQTADVPEQLVGRRVLREWAEIGQFVGAPHQLALPLRLGRVQQRAFVLGRHEPFLAAEIELGRLLWRLLTGVDRHLQVLHDLRATPGVADDLRLTPRELAVLGLLTEGLTAAAIARRLTIGERTVQKHLEHAYAKLGVGDRLSAVLRAQHLRLLPSANTG